MTIENNSEPYRYSGNNFEGEIKDPNNITRDECFALAKAGNEAWNKWRLEYPVRKKDEIHHWNSNVADFSNFTFSKSDRIHFHGFNFGDGANFRSTHFIDQVHLCSAHFGDDTDFKSASFDSSCCFKGSHFLGSVNFNDCKFSDGTDFGKNSENQAVIFGQPPLFHNAQMHSDTSFDGVDWPKTQNTDRAIRAYSVLKLAFSKVQNTRYERLFFQLEMDEEMHKAPPIMGWVRGTPSRTNASGDIGNLLPKEFYKAYRFFTGYGTSVARPLYLILCFVLVYSSLIFIYATYNGWSEWVGWNNIDWKMTTKLITRPFVNAFPFLGLQSDSVEELFTPTKTTYWTLVFGIVGGLQKFFSLVGWFLIGLALRNQFKMK